MATTTNIVDSPSAPAANPDWRAKPVEEMSNAELMAIAIARYPEQMVVSAIVTLALRAERAARK
jgi:hypothetical protein